MKSAHWLVYWLGLLHGAVLVATFLTVFHGGLHLRPVALLLIAMVVDLAGLHLAEGILRRG